MLLKKIRTKGFLGHLANENNDYVELDFADKNLWLIHGRNGAGKSSLFDAITMAFYKEHRASHKKTTRFVELIHNKADKAEIFVEFELKGNDYRIAVDIPKKSTVSRRLQFWNGADWETKNDDVDDWVTQNLKMKYDTFVSSVLLRQGEADKFITEKPTPRRGIFLELLQLGFYEKLTERAKNRQKNVGDRVKEIKQSLEGLENPSAADLKVQKKFVEQFSEEFKRLDEEQTAKKEELDNAKKAQKLKTDIEEIEVQQKLDAGIFEKAAQVEEKYNYFGELKENLLRFENVWREKNELKRIGEDLKENGQKLIELNGELEAVTEQLKENLSAQNSAQTALAALRDKLSSLETERDELKRKLDDIDRIEKLESQIETANEELKTAQTKIAKADEKIVELDKEIKEKTTEKDELDIKLQKSITDFKVWEDRLENRRKVIDKDECPTCGNELKSEEIRRRLIADFEEAEGTVKELKRQQNDLAENFVGIKNQLSANAGILKTETNNRQAFLQTKAALEATIGTFQSQITVSYKPAEREEIRGGFSELEIRVSELKVEFSRATENFEEIGKVTVTLGKSKVRLDADLRNTQEILDKLELRKQAAEVNLTKAENQISEKWKIHPALRDKSELENLRREKDGLQNIETEYANLKDARKREDNFKGKVELLSKQISEIPENHRRDAASVEIEFNEKVKQIGIVTMQISDANTIYGRMHEDKTKYEEKSGELKLRQTDLSIWKKLADALGKNGLETKVVREAQQKVEDNANQTLQALSGGNFKLELTDSGKDMKIFVRDFSTGEQRQIEYFSGGEKFLTAVSLAVAIGQSASGQNIANTLIIDEGFGALDDKNRDLMVGELTRLSEILQNGRVIIVSHQEDSDIQKNFANRFRLDKSDEGFINVQVSL